MSSRENLSKTKIIIITIIVFVITAIILPAVLILGGMLTYKLDASNTTDLPYVPTPTISAEKSYGGDTNGTSM